MAYTHPQQGATENAARLRKEAGAMLKALRKSAGKTQKDVAKELGLEYYTLISQVESGRTRLPPAQMEAYAKALGVPAKVLARDTMKYYDPVTFSLIFEK